MSEENQSESKEKIRRDFIALTEHSSQKITAWLDQIRTKKKGVKVTKKDLLNWIIERNSDVLSNSDLNAIVERFYDEEALLRQLLRDVKKARQEGSTEASLELIVRPKKTEPKKEPSAPDEGNQNENLS